MTINELIPGNIYSSVNHAGLFIFRSNGGTAFTSRLSNENSYQKSGNFGLGGSIEKNLRLPTQEEILQLEACEKAGKYQKYEEIY
mgnify:CR=1 FL=1